MNALTLFAFFYSRQVFAYCNGSLAKIYIRPLERKHFSAAQTSMNDKYHQIGMC